MATNRLQRFSNSVTTASDIAAIERARCDRMEARADTLKARCDELLDALVNITECAEAGDGGANMDLWIMQARAAIAKARP